MQARERAESLVWLMLNPRLAKSTRVHCATEWLSASHPVLLFPSQTPTRGGASGKVQRGRRRFALFSLLLLACTSLEPYLKDCWFWNPAEQFLPAEAPNVGTTFPTPTAQFLRPAVATSIMLWATHIVTLSAKQLWRWLTILINDCFGQWCYEVFGVKNQTGPFTC